MLTLLWESEWVQRFRMDPRITFGGLEWRMPTFYQFRCARIPGYRFRREFSGYRPPVPGCSRTMLWTVLGDPGGHARSCWNCGGAMFSSGNGTSCGGCVEFVAFFSLLFLIWILFVVANPQNPLPPWLRAGYTASPPISSSSISNSSSSSDRIASHTFEDIWKRKKWENLPNIREKCGENRSKTTKMLPTVGLKVHHRKHWVRVSPQLMVGLRAQHAASVWNCRKVTFQPQFSMEKNKNGSKTTEMINKKRKTTLLNQVLYAGNQGL